MASNTSDGASRASSQKTPAQMLMEKHAAAADHKPTVEEVVDEDDIQHPPPAHSTVMPVDAPAQPAASNAMMSAKAAGKQRADIKSSVIDTQSEEAFPSLGPASKASAVPAKAPGWGPKAPLKSGVSPASSGAATPTSNPGRPSPAAAARGTAPNVNLPGKFRDSFEIAIADIDKTKSVERVLQDVRRKYKVNAFSEDAGFATRRRFVAEGPRQQVLDALLQISKEVSVERKETIEIPAGVSPQIIGKGGANIRQLEKEYQVKIQVHRDQKEPLAGQDDLRIDTVEIRGHSAASQLAKQRINSMVKELQPKVDMPVRGIPPEFYPFIRGRHASELQKLEQDNDLRIQVPQFHTWSQQPPPRPDREDKPPVYVPHGDSHIVVSGEQAAAQQARLEIERLAERLQQELLLREYTCDQVLHPYLVGNRGIDPLQFLEETGCAVILPPAHQATDDIHIVGPADKIEAGIQRVDELMSQRQPRTLDLAKQYADAPMGADRHSRALARYLQQRAIEEEFASIYGADVVFPAQLAGATTWTVVTSEPQKAVAAKNDLAKITQAFPSSRLNLVEIDPFFQPFIQELHAESFKQQHGVHLIIPEDEDDHVVLVFEGPTRDGPFSLPRNRPTNPEVAAFQQALKAAQADLLASIPQQGISERELKAPRKHHDRVRRHVKNTHQSQTPFPINIEYGMPAASRRQQSSTTASPDSIFLRGTDDDELEMVRRMIEQFLVEVEEDEKERGYVTTFDFPQKYVKNLVGKQGANIKALREKHDVEIDTREPGKVKIQGPQKKADACKAEIIKLGKQYEDEVNYVIKVDPKYHGELIGKGGENLTRLQEKVNNEVRIDFPRVTRSNDNQATADGGSDFGGPTKQALDEIRIRGPRAKSDKVREELLSLSQYLVDNSHTATVSVARDQIASLIGKAGAEMDKLRAETGAQIDVPNRQSEGDGNRVTLTIKGSKVAVDKAKSELSKRSKAFDAVVSKTITVDKKHHKNLIGAGGSNIRRIVIDAGGPEQSAEAVRFPRPGEESDELTVKGVEDVVNKIVAAIQSFVEEKENSVTETMDVPTELHRNLIGAGGLTRREIEDKFKVSLDIPRRESGKTGVRVSGQPANVAKAKEHITSITKQPEGVVIEVPLGVHHMVSQNGQLFRQLNGQGIKVDHKGQRPPAKPQTNGGSRARSTNGAMPLITDEAGGQRHSFEMVQTGGDTGEVGTIPWVLFSNRDGSEEKLAKAKQNIEEAIKRSSAPQYTGYLILADPQLHRHVIGRGGNTINRIRKQTGCDIQVPKGGSSEDEAISIVGAQDGVVDARDLILQEIERAGEGRD